MGQKANPIGFRVGYNRDWASMWFAEKSYSQFLKEDYDIRSFLKSNIKAKLAKVGIFRAHAKLTVNVHCDKPGLVIGKKGSEIEKIRNKLINHLALPDVTFNVLEEKKIDLNAPLVAQNIAAQIERRSAHRRVMRRAMVSAMKAGAVGVKVQCAGRLADADIARREKFHEGSVPLSTISANISYGFAEAKTTYGIIGVKVWIYRGKNVTA